MPLLPMAQAASGDQSYEAGVMQDVRQAKMDVVYEDAGSAPPTTAPLAGGNVSAGNALAGTLTNAVAMVILLVIGFLAFKGSLRTRERREEE